MTVIQALALASSLGVERLDAQLLLAHHLDRQRSWLLAHGDAELSDAAQCAFAADCGRRADDVPLAYLVGEREFHGLALKVSPAVLVPRADTETLVDWALQMLSDELAERSAPRVIDMGTGSGAIALAIKKRWPSAIVCACDSSAAALDVARLNARSLDVEVEFVLSDWWAALASRRFDLVVGNPPYIAGNDLHLQALRHEPIFALSPGAGGLEAIDHLVDSAPHHLVPLGWLMLEHGHDQADAVCQRLRSAGFDRVQSRADLAGHRRCSGGRLKRVASGT